MQKKPQKHVFDVNANDCLLKYLSSAAQKTVKEEHFISIKVLLIFVHEYLSN